MLSLVLGQGWRLILAGAYAVGRLLLAALPILPPRDPLALAIIKLTLVVVALFACLIPARRAMKVDPMIALRSE